LALDELETSFMRLSAQDGWGYSCSTAHQHIIGYVKTSSRHVLGLRHVERHFECALQTRMVVMHRFPSFYSKTHTKWCSRWRNAWCEM